MEILVLKEEALRKALDTLHSSLKKIKSKDFENLYEELRDSVIQRFEYSADAMWKYLKVYMGVKLKVRIISKNPAALFKQALDEKVISADEYEVLGNIVEDRNRTSHAYNENLAESISDRVSSYHMVMHTIVERLSKNLSQES